MNCAPAILGVPSISAWLWLFVLLIGSSLAYLILYSWSSGLSHIPGPWLARYTDAWSLYCALKETYGRDVKNKGFHLRLQAKYGDIVRTGPRTVVVMDPAALPAIYGMKKRLSLGPAYNPFRQPGVKTSLLSIHEPEMHARYRRLIANAYALSSLKGYEPYVDEVINRFMEVCGEHADVRNAMDAKAWSHYYAYDAISILTFGKPFGFMSGDGKDIYGLVTAVSKFDDYRAYCSQMPWLHRIIVENPLMRKVKPSPFQAAVRQRIHTRIQEIRQNPEKSGARPDILSYFIATHGAQPEIMNERQVVIFASVNFMAGALGPATSLNAAFRHLVQYPDVQENLVAELKSAGVTAPAQFDDIKDLPYLYGVMRETYRLHRQPGAFTLQRIVGSEGMDLPGGVHLPPGTYVGCSTGVMNVVQSSWGTDAKTFRPERWMQNEGETEEQYAERKRTMDKADLTFGQGSRTCLGKSVTALELYKVIATMVLLFRFEAAPDLTANPDSILVRRRVKT